MEALNIEPLLTDKKFFDSPDAGPDCLCSRCLKPIEEPEIPVRAWPEEMHNYPEGKCPAEYNYEYRYHLKCIFPNAKTIEDYPENDFDDSYELGDDLPC